MKIKKYLRKNNTRTQTKNISYYFYDLNYDNKTGENKHLDAKQKKSLTQKQNSFQAFRLEACDLSNYKDI